MIRPVFATGFLVLSLASSVAWFSDAPRAGVDWPSFRGHRASGVADGFPLPTTWNVEQSNGVIWKTPIPGLGHSSPVIWKNRVCVTTSVGGDEAMEFRDQDRQRLGKDTKLKTKTEGREIPASSVPAIVDERVLEWQVTCVDKTSGKVAWTQTAYRGVPSSARHAKSTHASATLATDGTHLVAFFGTEGLYCYRLADGRLLWKKSLGTLDSGWYEVPAYQFNVAGSPVIIDGKVVLQVDVQQDSFIAAFAVKDGKEIWRTPRRDVPTWGTPGIVEEGGRVQLVANGWREMAGYDLATGRGLWTMNGPKGGDIPVPTPITAHGLIFLTNAHGSGSPIYAIRTSARGDVSLKEGTQASEHVAWSLPRDGAYVPTPIVYGDHLYINRDNGVLGVYEAATGTRLYQERIGEGRTRFTASPVAGDGKVYMTSEDGDIFVVKAGPRFELLAENPMGEPCLATPAISEGRLYFRTRAHLVAIGSTGAAAPASK